MASGDGDIVSIINYWAVISLYYLEVIFGVGWTLSSILPSSASVFVALWNGTIVLSKNADYGFTSSNSLSNFLYSIV